MGEFPEVLSRPRKTRSAFNERDSIFRRVHDSCGGRWRDILTNNSVQLPPGGKHGPCPACGGKDRFRFDDKEGRGTWFCNQCEPQAGDGIDLFANVYGLSEQQAAQEIARLEGIDTNAPNPVKPALVIKSIDEAKKKSLDQDRAAATVRKIWDNASPAPHDHPYLASKNIQPHNTRIHRDGRLIIPLFNANGEVRSIQYIAPNGEKRYHPGGQTRACFWRISSPEVANTVYLAEGFATAATIHEVTKACCFVAYSASNLPKVAGIIKAQYPSHRLIIAADNDESGTGKKYADQCDSEVIMPTLAGDFNDHPNQILEATKEPQPALDDNFPPDWVSEPFDYSERQEVTEAQQHRFKFLKLGELKVKPIDWVVKDFIEANSLGLIYGTPGAGKSFIGIDIACSIATNTSWHGHKVKQGSVFYVAGEGHNGLARRFEAWSKINRTHLNDAHIYPSSCALDLSNTTEVNHLIQSIESSGQIPLVVVIDTLARNYLGDENSAKDMGLFISNIDRIRERWGCTVLIVHHSGKDSDRGARGSTALRGAIDAEYAITKDANQNVTMTCTKMKDAEIPEPKYFQIEGVDLGLIDEDGQVITGAALVPSVRPEKTLNSKLEKHRQTLIDAWKEGGSKLSGRNPYLSRDDFIEHIKEAYGITTHASAKKYVAPSTDGKPVCELLKAGVITKHSAGWIISCPDLIKTLAPFLTQISRED